MRFYRSGNPRFHRFPGNILFRIRCRFFCFCRYFRFHFFHRYTGLFGCNRFLGYNRFVYCNRFLGYNRFVRCNRFFRFRNLCCRFIGTGSFLLYWMYFFRFSEEYFLLGFRLHCFQTFFYFFGTEYLCLIHDKFFCMLRQYIESLGCLLILFGLCLRVFISLLLPEFFHIGSQFLLHIDRIVLTDIHDFYLNVVRIGSQDFLGGRFVHFCRLFCCCFLCFGYSAGNFVFHFGIFFFLGRSKRLMKHF